MKILTTEQIKQADAYTIAYEPIESVDLMERAAWQCSQWLMKKYNKRHRFVIFAGPGNNGGDGLAIARQLAGKGYEVKVCLLNISNRLSPDAEVNQNRLQEQGLVEVGTIESPDDFPVFRHDDIIVDALFGSGLKRPFEKLPLKLVQYINSTENKVTAIDIPSGLFGEDNSGNDPEKIMVADHTLTFQFPKLSFFFAENERYLGKWHVLDIGLHSDFIADVNTPYYYLNKKRVTAIRVERKKFSHKGTFGHGLLISGCYGMMGAAILASKASIRSGIGLLTTHVPRLGYEILQSTVPEVLVDIDDSDILFTHLPNLDKYAAIGVGPGLSTKPNVQKALLNLLENVQKPMVIDADAINILGMNREWLDKLPEDTILTPHPREFERITEPVQDDYSRCMLLQDFVRKYRVNVILKGAHTAIADKEGYVYFNTTGNPGMATGGSGDVLTGIILALLAQGYASIDAAKLGVFVHGLAGDIAVKKLGKEALIASDIIDHLGKAFRKLK